MSGALDSGPGNMSSVTELHVMVPDDVAARLHELAETRGATEDELASKALRAYLPSSSDSEATTSRQLGFVSLGASGRSDVAQRAEEILRAEFP